MKTLVSSESVAGKISAAPTPITARAAISSPGLLPSPPAKLATPNTTSPASSTPLRPDPVAEVAGGEHEAANNRL